MSPADTRPRRAPARSGRNGAPRPVQVPRWLPVVSLALLAVAFVVSAYLTYEHYTGNASLACPATGAFDCAKVTTSPQSRILGIPVAVLGLVFSAGMTPLSLPAAWRSANPWLRRARVAGVVTGVAFVVYFVYVELFRVEKICPWCTVVHVAVVALFGVTIWAALVILPALDERRTRQA